MRRLSLALIMLDRQSGAWRGHQKSVACCKNGNRPYYTRAEQAESLVLVKYHVWMLWTKEKSSKKCVLPTAFAPRRFTLHQRNTSYSNVSPPSGHYACPNPKQAQGPLRSHNIPAPKNIHNISLYTKIFHSNLDIIFKKIQQSSQTYKYFIDPTTHFWGDSISIILFFLLIIKM